jgi:hypothetical protein
LRRPSRNGSESRTSTLLKPRITAARQLFDANVVPLVAKLKYQIKVATEVATVWPNVCKHIQTNCVERVPFSLVSI